MRCAERSLDDHGGRGCREQNKPDEENEGQSRSTAAEKVVGGVERREATKETHGR